MRVLVSGAHGLVGRALLPALAATGMEARPLVRGNSGAAIWWDLETGAVNAAALNEWKPEALIHLAGENIAARRWNTEQKHRIRESRVGGTQRLVSSLLALQQSPAVFISASAVGYYGNRGDELLTEESSPANDFLAEVCRGWEEAANPLREHGVRVVHLRFGMIIGRSGGAVRRMLPIFKLGLGGKVGSGRQWISWIALRDVVRIIEWALTNSAAAGPYNAVSPNPLTNAEFTRALAKALKRPAIFPVPAFVLRAAFGELADALLLTSQRALPRRLREEGFDFEFPDLVETLRREI